MLGPRLLRSIKPRLRPEGIRRTGHATPFYPQKLALTSPTSGGRSVGIVRSRTKATELVMGETPANHSCTSPCKVPPSSRKVFAEFGVLTAQTVNRAVSRAIRCKFTDGPKDGGSIALHDLMFHNLRFLTLPLLHYIRNASAPANPSDTPRTDGEVNGL
jgi:hypothetical protein